MVSDGCKETRRIELSWVGMHQQEAYGRRQHEFQIAHAWIRDKLNVNVHAWVANKHVAGDTHVHEGLLGLVW
jgi:hypothetical protein